ncbi:hypothetical protein LTR97_005031 [Elasticomyces elasticus]|uniref:Heterokaryon incompatibility domain-containing protein n=1 Tax=Elasticomyces elasticus TaxID=574655 RepID=A0AAN7ZNQ0_9PEZI|nr:hypothetical protein LTR97_005031 [Elasticomyces elasticus]
MSSKLDPQMAVPTDLVEVHTDVTRLYTPITKWQTRILRLHAGTKDTPLRADLLVAGLIHDEGIVLDWTTNESVSYEAISYSWGSDKATELITVNGLDCYINSSLASALRRFRGRSADRYLWADQLCIFQAANAEKSVQVGNMFTIFRKAERVLVWLGEEDEGTVKALAYYMRMAARETTKRNGEQFAPIVVKNVETYNALATICLTPWPRRVWVQQEVFAARQLAMHHGRGSFTLGQYRDLVKIMCESPIKSKQTELERQWRSLLDLRMSDQHMIQLDRGKVASTSWLTAIKEPFTAEEAGTFNLDESDSAYISTLLETILSRSRNLEASNTKDYVYALLNLTHHNVATNELNGNAIDIDYASSVERVYEDVTRSILNRDESLRILKYSNRRRGSRVDLKLPSWVVDWPSLNREATFWIPDGELSKLARQEDNERGTLDLYGFRLGRVALIDRQSKTTDGEHQFVTYLRVLSHCSFPGSRSDLNLPSLLAANTGRRVETMFSDRRRRDLTNDSSRDEFEIAANEAVTNIKKIISRTSWLEETTLVDDERLDVMGLPLTDEHQINIGYSQKASLVLDGARIGDLVVQVDGWLYPIVLREIAMENTFDFVCLVEYASPDCNLEWPSHLSTRGTWRNPIELTLGRKHHVGEVRRAFQKHMKSTQQHAMERFVIV